MYIALRGVSIDRGTVLGFGLLLALILTVVSHHSVVRFMLDWLPFAVLLYLYDFTRTFADNGRAVHVLEPVHFDRAIGFGRVPTQWLQEHLVDPAGAHWWEALVALTYVSHFIVPYVVVILLWFRNRQAWKEWVVAFFTTSVLGLIGYVLYPMAPPWMAGSDRYPYHVDALRGVRRVARRGLELLDLKFADRLIESGARVGNQVAAMPSIHTAFSVLFAVFFFVRLRSPWRWALFLYPTAMAFTLVYSGEHYVVDVLAGAACALIGFAVARRLVPDDGRVNAIPAGI